MPQITVNSINIQDFGWAATFNPRNQSIFFDTANLTTYNDPSGTGALYVRGIAFSVIDQEGVVLASIDWNNPQIRPALGQTSYTLDLSSIGIDFFFQTYSIIGAIKDENGTVYSTTQINPKICQPVGITSGGYVPGIFQVTANCPDNVLTVKEVTPLVYNNLTPSETSKSGTLTYPSGTISPISFSGTPFSNNVIYTGQYRVNCTTLATYDFGNDIYVAISYITNNVFELTCANRVSDILCCLVDLQNTKQKNCNNAIGERAAQQLQSVETPLFIALAKELSGQDASEQVAYIRKTLNCSCGANSIIQNEFTPINPAVTTIVLNGVGGTSIAPPTITGNTKTYNIQSNVYQVVKGDPGDLAFSIKLNTATSNTIKYVITINYEQLATSILNEISGNSTLLTMFNSLVTITNFQVDLTNLNGGCIIDLSAINYFLTLKVPAASNTIVSVLVNGTTYTAPSPIAVNNPTAIELWLNGLGIGTFDASFSTGTTGSYFNLLTVGNVNVVTSAVLNTGSNVTVLFQKTITSLIAFLQAVVDYMCSLSDLEIALHNDITVCYVDYNGDKVSTTYPALTTKQSTLNEALANALCNTVSKISQTFNNAITRVGSLVQWGGTLVQNTTVNQNGLFVKFLGDSNNYVQFDSNSFTSFTRAGTAGTDNVNILFNRNNLFVSERATNADRAAIAYYAKTQIITQFNSGVSDVVSMGTYIPTSLDSGTPAPAIDPEKTARIRAIYDSVTGKGSLEYYGKTQTHTGSSSDFDTLLSAKEMTTAERDAIDVSLLTRNRIIFNTTVGKHQGWNGSVWTNFY